MKHDEKVFPRACKSPAFSASLIERYEPSYTFAYCRFAATVHENVWPAACKGNNAKYSLIAASRCVAKGMELMASPSRRKRWVSPGVASQKNTLDIKTNKHNARRRKDWLARKFRRGFFAMIAVDVRGNSTMADIINCRRDAFLFDRIYLSISIDRVTYARNKTETLIASICDIV